MKPTVHPTKPYEPGTAAVSQASLKESTTTNLTIQLSSHHTLSWIRHRPKVCSDRGFEGRHGMEYF
ncbi:hypothetical protein E2C01_067529 [Portunus trituberculatus]|uniref:Uncharacterized protein n=1 Tax=Portunus trituberculatus TaxID=210409 RepID=A0A5B7HWY8_PORTR|nr:hypothetical protein [Portunus trituberculatus]